MGNELYLLTGKIKGAADHDGLGELRKKKPQTMKSSVRRIATTMAKKMRRESRNTISSRGGGGRRGWSKSHNRQGAVVEFCGWAGLVDDFGGSSGAGRPGAREEAASVAPMGGTADGQEPYRT